MSNTETDTYEDKNSRKQLQSRSQELLQLLKSEAGISKRGLIGGIATLPVLAVPALASISPDHPDAELLRLAVQLEAVAPELEAEDEGCSKHAEEWGAACERAGLPFVAWTAWPSGDMDEWREYQNKRFALMPPHDDEEDENGKTKFDRIIDRLWPIVDEILELQPKTVDGLRVQARAVALTDPELWVRAGESYWLSGFLTSVFAFLGVDDKGHPLKRDNKERGTGIASNAGPALMSTWPRHRGAGGLRIVQATSTNSTP